MFCSKFLREGFKKLNLNHSLRSITSGPDPSYQSQRYRNSSQEKSCNWWCKVLYFHCFKHILKLDVTESGAVSELRNSFAVSTGVVCGCDL